MKHDETMNVAKNSVVEWWNDSQEYIDLWGKINTDTIEVVLENDDHMENCDIVVLKVFSIMFIFKYYERVNRAYLDVYDVISRSLILLD